MKLYRIYKKEAFVTRLGELELVEWHPPAESDLPPTIRMVPGVPIEIVDKIAAHWAERRVVIAEKEEPYEQIIPEHWEEKQVKEEGHYETKDVTEPGHYETKEIWVPEYNVTKIREVPGHEELAKRIVPAWIEYKEVVVPENVARRIPAHTEIQEIVHPETYEHYKVWTETTYEEYLEVVPAGNKMQRVWVEEKVVSKEVWVPTTYTLERVLVPAQTFVRARKIEEHVGRETYWQEETERKTIIQEPMVEVAGVPWTPGYAQAMADWFAWYQGTAGGQIFLESIKQKVYWGELKGEQIIQMAYQGYRQFQPDISVRLTADVVVKMRPWELDNMLKDPSIQRYLISQGMDPKSSELYKQMQELARKPWTAEELKTLGYWGLVVAAIVAGIGLVYYTWPGAKFELTVSYPDPVYVGVYREQFNELDLVGVSAAGTPMFYRTGDIGGPIISEERSAGHDKWTFGEEWSWSAWVEEAKWMGIGETRYWYSAEVEYLGMLTTTGARFYSLHKGRMDIARGGHEPGWVKPSTLWGTWEEIEHHIRI